MTEQDSDELLKEIDRYCLLNNIDSGDIKKLIHFHLSIIISNYEKLQRQMVLRTENDNETL
jgi:hypothetical protein